MQTIHTFFKCYPKYSMNFLLLDILQGTSSKPQTQTHQACLFPITLERAELLLFFRSITISQLINSRKKGRTSHFTLNCTREQRVNWKWSEREKLALFFPSCSQLSSSFCYYKRPEGQTSLYISSTSVDMICPQGIPLLCITTIPRPFFLWAFLFHYSSIIVSDKKNQLFHSVFPNSSSFEMDMLTCCQCVLSSAANEKSLKPTQESEVTHTHRHPISQGIPYCCSR